MLCRWMNGLCASTTKCTGALQDDETRTRNNEWRLENSEWVKVQWFWKRQIWKRSLGDYDRHNACVGLQIKRNACFVQHCVVDSSYFVIHYHWEESGHWEEKIVENNVDIRYMECYLDEDQRRHGWGGVWPCAEAEKTQHKLRGHFCHFIGLS